MKSIAAHVQPLMIQRRWTVGLLQEFCPKVSAGRMGWATEWRRKPLHALRERKPFFNILKLEFIVFFLAPKFGNL
jgi:hypothetical protein